MSRQQFSPTERVSHYTIERLIGQGGYGDIYLVRDSRNMKDYAMKTELLTSTKQALQNEIDLLADLKTAYFPAIRGYGDSSHCRYFVMDILGPSISSVRRHIETKRFNRMIGLAVAEETLRIIQTLHELGIVHRDIKPSNFLLRPRSNSPLCLIDFGLAKRVRDHSKSSQPGERRFTGTIKYASPNAHQEWNLHQKMIYIVGSIQ
jgi:serine/threonine protein kinase